ncbi:12779_t:CDS:1, partial [Dentiscutata heterogama]
DIKSYDYTEFSDPKEIGKGGFGVVYKSIALKKLINIPSNQEKTMQEFIKE